MVFPFRLLHLVDHIQLFKVPYLYSIFWLIVIFYNFLSLAFGLLFLEYFDYVSNQAFKLLQTFQHFLFFVFKMYFCLYCVFYKEVPLVLAFSFKYFFHISSHFHMYFYLLSTTSFSLLGTY